jgi:hypothetical protein
MKYDQAMQTPERKQWEMRIEEEFQRMNLNKVWEPINKCYVPFKPKILTSTWAIKKPMVISEQE